MITRITMFSWKPDLPEGHVEKLVGALSTLPGLVPALRDYRFGPSTDGRNFDFAVVASVDDEDGLREYSENAEHGRIREELVLPWIVGPSGMDFTS